MPKIKQKAISITGSSRSKFSQFDYYPETPRAVFIYVQFLEHLGIRLETLRIYDYSRNIFKNIFN